MVLTAQISHGKSNHYQGYIVVEVLGKAHIVNSLDGGRKEYS